MKKTFLTVLVFITSMNVQAALPPSAENQRDLDVLVDFIKQHKKVAETLISIDFRSHTIMFDNGCKAYFEKKKASLFALSMPGPQPLIEFKSSSCTLTDD